MRSIGLIILAIHLFHLCVSQPQTSHDIHQIPLTYGSLVKLYSQAGKKWLHSHEIKFGRGGMFSVTGSNFEDSGNYWQILEEYPHHSKTYTQTIQCGDIIRLRSPIIGYNIRADDTTFGLTTELLPMVHGVLDSQSDPLVNWKMNCVNKDEGETLYFQDLVKLKNSVSGKWMILDPSSQYTEFNCGKGCDMMRQVQIHASESAESQMMTFKVVEGLGFVDLDQKQKQVVEK